MSASSATPATAQPGQAINLAATVKSAKAVGNYIVGFQVSLNNQIVSQQMFQNLSSTKGGSVTESYNWNVPATAAPGTYNVLVGVWDSNWNWYNGTSMQVSVVAPQTAVGNFTVAAESATPNATQPGQTVKLAATVASKSAVGQYTTGFQISLNNQVISQQMYPSLTSAQGGSVTESYNWTVPANAAAGTYNVLVGVWDENWNWYTGNSTTVQVASVAPAVSPPPPAAPAPTSPPASPPPPPVASPAPPPVSPSPAAGANLPGATQQAPYYACATNWYVDASNGNDGNAGTSAATAFQTIGQATWKNAKLSPGACVNVAPGTYPEFVWVDNSSMLGGNSNSPTGYVVLRSSTPLAAKIVGPSSNGYSAVTMPASYAIIDGFDVSGGADGGHCIDGGYDLPSNHAHHLIAINNHVHDCGGGGISFAGGDYYVVENNVANNTSATSGYQTSGISICCTTEASGFTPTAADNVHYHNVIRNNVSHDNVETFSCSALGMGAGCHTDGEGIIIDCFDCGGMGIYTSPTLVVGNLVYGNGGNGIQVGRSSNVTVANNTSYGNYLDLNNAGTLRAELGNIAGTGNIWVNNIAWATPGSGLLSYNVALADTGAMTISGVTYPASNGIWNNNIYFGAGVAAAGGASISTTNNVDVNPGFTSLASDNFNPAAGSPAIGTSLPEGFLTAAKPDVGAY